LSIYKDVHVAVVPADNEACGHYRIVNPISYLRTLGAKVELYNDIRKLKESKAPVCIIQRAFSQVAESIVDHCNSQGKKVIYELDDNLHHIAPSSPAYKAFHTGSEALKGVGRIIRKCYGMTVSTVELASVYSSMCPNIRVTPNSIDFAIRDWITQDPLYDRNYLTIGYSGGTTHMEDLQVISDVIPDILNKHKHTRFALYTNEKMANAIVNNWNLDRKRVLIVPPRSFAQYPQGLSVFDIGLAVVKNTTFNSSKSNLKILEKGSWGIPVIASVCPPYSSTITHGANGLLANTSIGWFESLDYLVSNPDVGKRMGSRLKELIETNYDQAVTIHRWPKAWSDICLSSPRMEERSGALVSKKIGRNDPCTCGSGIKQKKCCGL
jgi:O-antigen biosynthesis protein